MQVLTAALMGFLFVTGAITADASSTPKITAPEYTVGMTAYNATIAQTDSDPKITASGVLSNPDVIAARSQDLSDELPFGTVIAIVAATSSPSCGYNRVGQLIGLRVIADSMNVKMKNKIDIMLPQKETLPSGKTGNPAIVLGQCKNVAIKVVGHVDLGSIPTTQSELAAALGSSGEVASAK
jgi:3D (Asp-Asp-Asp) domain-containing protein